MSLSKQIVRNKEECVQALSGALPDITEHVLRLIAEFVPYRKLTIRLRSVYGRVLEHS